MTAAKKLQSSLAGFAGEAEGAWDLSYAYYNPPESLAWDISTAYHYGIEYSVAAQNTTPRGLFFKPDGTKMYVVGATTTNSVHEYDLSTAWDVSTASYLQNFSMSDQDTSPRGIHFKPDGTKMYVVGDTGDDINEYDLSTAWNVSTASYLQNFSIDSSPRGVFFKEDGTKMYTVAQASAIVKEYDLSTAWDISSASFLQSFSVSTQDTSPQGIHFKPDGTKMYVVGGIGDDINEYDLSTAWDVSTASFVQNLDLSSYATTPTSAFFKPDGTVFYVVSTATDTVLQYSLGGFNAQDGQPSGIHFKPDGTKMYILGYSGDAVNEYSLSTEWDVSSASYVQNFSVSAQGNTPQDLFFKPDGTRMYTVGSASDRVSEYTLSTAWDVSTASYLRDFRVSFQETAPQGLFFKSDGTKMYIVGNSNDTVYQYTLSSAWNVTTASYDSKSFSVTSQESTPQGLFFKDDGTKMYVVGSGSDSVHEYDLSTEWDVSSASYVQNLDLFFNVPTSTSIFFKDDGTQMFIIGRASDRVWAYTLGVQE